MNLTMTPFEEHDYYVTQHDPLHVLGLLVLFICLLGFYFAVGRLSAKPNRMQRQIIHRALEALPPSSDPFIAERQATLLDRFAPKRKKGCKCKPDLSSREPPLLDPEKNSKRWSPSQGEQGDSPVDHPGAV
jgi:hypothetical protein